MEVKPYTSEVGKMWRWQQQLLRTTLERLVKGNKLAKLTIVADEIGMGHDEFHSKVSITPRTPLQNSERIAIEHEILKRDAELYNYYLCELHLCDRITVEEK